MSEESDLLAEMTDRLFAELLDETALHALAGAEWPAAAWATIEDHGLPRALVQGEQGFDIPLEDGLALVRLLGRHAISLPLAETMIGQFLLATAGLPLPQGPLGLVPAAPGLSLYSGPSGWRAKGEAERVAWGRAAQALLVEDGEHLALMRSGFELVAEGTNLAGSPRDQITMDGPVEVVPRPATSLIEAGALIRALSLAGAMETLLSLTARYVGERQQFGRSLSSFQAVQHQLAQLAGETAAAGAAAGLAASAFATASPQAGVAIAAARCRIAEAAGIGIGIAHQLHGAIGFTSEHPLHLYTAALWSWRDEFGSAGWWTRRLGTAALHLAKADYWPFVTAV